LTGAPFLFGIPFFARKVVGVPACRPDRPVSHLCLTPVRTHFHPFSYTKNSWPDITCRDQLSTHTGRWAATGIHSQTTGAGYPNAPDIVQQQAETG